MTSRPVTDLRRLAESLAREAGELALEGRRSVANAANLGGVTKSTRTDLVTEFDRGAEDLIVAGIRSNRPNDAIIGEEGTNEPGSSGYAWHIDPIDGTTNFVYDQPAWCCSIAVEHEGTMIAGAVFVPPLDEMFTAGLGAGATLNGKTIRPTAESDLGLALVGTGFAYDPKLRHEQALVVSELISQVRDIRRLGSAAFDLCMVACGRLDIYYESYLNSWDAAAGELIAREAGAITSDFSGARSRPEEMIAAAPGLHQAFLNAARFH